jgi:hypothetical protein
MARARSFRGAITHLLGGAESGCHGDYVYKETFCDRQQRDSGSLSTFKCWGVTSLLIDVLGLGFNAFARARLQMPSN